MLRNIAIILAGGSGNRMQAETPKAFIKIHARYLIEYSILQFQKNESIDEIILVVPKDYQSLSEEAIQPKYPKISQILQGGASRYESSCIGVNSINEQEAKLLIHDAARPLLTQRLIQESINALDQFDAVNILAPIADTLVQLENQKISHLLDRTQIRLAQTPQSFKHSSIKKAQLLAKDTPIEQITDDFNLVLLHQTGSNSWIEGNPQNFKITYPQDLAVAKMILDPSAPKKK